MAEYLKVKMSEEDWHGVADAAMDLREIEVEIKCQMCNGVAMDEVALKSQYEKRAFEIAYKTIVFLDEAIRRPVKIMVHEAELRVQIARIEIDLLLEKIKNDPRAVE